MNIFERYQVATVAHCGEHAKKMHEGVYLALGQSDPADLQALARENPSLASDNLSVAFYQNVEKIGKTRTVAKIGKYIKRHWPTLADNIIRDIVARCDCGEIKIISELSEIIATVQNGPYSCMKMSGKAPGEHPYNVYDPCYGWHLAVRIKDGVTLGRALLNGSNFVRVYAYMESDIYAPNPDFALQSKLESMGYKKVDSWDNLRLAKITNQDDDYLMPYLDGSTQSVKDCGDYWQITRRGEYECRSTDGVLENDTDCYYCCHCGARIRIDRDASYSTQDGEICESCGEGYVYIDEFRVSVNGRDRWIGGYHVPSEDAFEHDGSYYLTEYASELGFVLCANDDYLPIDDCIFDIDSEEWYQDGEHDLKYCEDDGNYHSEYFWQCSISGNYYHETINQVTLANGNIAHDSNAVLAIDGQHYDELECTRCNESFDYYPDTLPLAKYMVRHGHGYIHAMYVYPSIHDY